MMSSITQSGMTLPIFLLCLGSAAIIGILNSLVFTFHERKNSSFALTLALLPMAISVVIMMVNGNIGAGVAVAGAFTLVRFRSAPGSAKEIASIFVSMALGLIIGMGYLGIAVIFFASSSLMTLLLTWVNFGGMSNCQRIVKITLPETYDYNGLFDEVFTTYTKSATLEKVHTTNMGTLYEVVYRVELKDSQIPKAMIDDIRSRNGNLNVSILMAAEKDITL